MTSRIRLVFAKGSTVVKVPSVSEERVGPVLAAAMTACAPGDDGIHTVPVKEIPSAALGAPLKHFLAKGKLPLSASASPHLLSPSYKAAERLDIAEMVRAVERAAMDAIASGDVRIEELSSSFAGCPRIAALCDNYLSMPGTRAPPPFNPRSHLHRLAREHGAVLVIGKELPGLTRFWILVANATCSARAGTSSNVVYTHAHRMLKADYSTTEFTVFSMDEDADITAYGPLVPQLTTTWLAIPQFDLQASPSSSKQVTDMFRSLHSVDIIAAAQHDARHSATTIYSRDTLSDFLIDRGVEAVFGPPCWL